MFNEKYSKYKNLVQKELNKIGLIIENSIDINGDLQKNILKFLESPSKKIRLVLPLLYLKAFSQKITNEHLELLSAVEIIHNSSLIHDDIIDNSELRRGEKTLNSVFGNKLGVISGDYLLSIAMGFISKLNNTEILKTFSQTLKQMCIGEINQSYDRFKIGTIENYIEKSKNKTAYLFQTALLCSLMLSQGDFDMEKSSEFGLNFGIAFQIRDDLLNVLQTDTSKPFSNDIKEGIYNAPVIYSGNLGNISIGIEKTRILLNNYINYALSSLSNLPQNEYKTALIEISELLKND